MAKLKARISMSLTISPLERHVIQFALRGAVDHNVAFSAGELETVKHLDKQLLDMDTLESNFRESIVRINNPHDFGEFSGNTGLMPVPMYDDLMKR